MVGRAALSFAARGQRFTVALSPASIRCPVALAFTKLKAVAHATGISSSPWDWLVNQKPIDYARVAVNSVAGGSVTASRPLIAYRGEMNPFIIFVALPALFAAAAAIGACASPVATHHAAQRASERESSTRV